MLALEWLPCVAAVLGLSPDDSHPTITFHPHLGVPAVTDGHRIEVDPAWVRQHPTDLGLVIHEVVHVVLSLTRVRRRDLWLVEGLADYVRYHVYEPADPRRRPPVTEASSYTEGYAVAAAFVAWLEEGHPGTIPALAQALRDRTRISRVLKQRTRQDADALWQRYRKLAVQESRE